MSNIKDLKLTKTSLLMLKGLKLNEKKLVDLGLINCYIGDKDYEREIEQKLFLVFSVPEGRVLEFGEFILSHEGRIFDEYDYEGGITVLVFDFLDEIVWKLFISGKYSKFPIYYKELFKEKADGLEKSFGFNISSGWMIVNKHPELKKFNEERIGVELEDWQEVSSIIDVEREIFDYDKFINNL